MSESSATPVRVGDAVRQVRRATSEPHRQSNTDGARGTERLCFAEPPKRRGAYQLGKGLATSNCPAAPRQGASASVAPAPRAGVGVAQRNELSLGTGAFGLHHHQVVPSELTLTEGEEDLDEKPPGRGLISDDDGFRHRGVLSLGLLDGFVDSTGIL